MSPVVAAKMLINRLLADRQKYSLAIMIQFAHTVLGEYVVALSSGPRPTPAFALTGTLCARTSGQPGTPTRLPRSATRVTRTAFCTCWAPWATASTRSVQGVDAD